MRSVLLVFLSLVVFSFVPPVSWAQEEEQPYDIEEEFVDRAFSLSDIVVFEALGSGRIPPKLIPLIERHSSLGKIVILSSTVASGHLYDEYDFEGSYQFFLKRNVIMSPLNSKKSCILARLCLGNGKRYEEMKDIFESFWD